MEEVFDHTGIGKQFKYFISPPAIKQEVGDFKDGLKEIIPQKLRQLLDRSFVLKEKHDFELRLINASTQSSSFEEYFHSSLAFHEFSEYYVIHQWINYWLSLYYEINPKSLPTELINKLNQLEQLDIEKAKKNPIQSFYNGRLRQNASRLVGLCPLHQEKTPSFNIYIDNNTFHCFGCQAHGDAISFIQETKNLSFPEAVRYLL